MFGPWAIFLGISATFVFVFFSFWSSLSARATKKVDISASRLDRAGIIAKPQEIVLSVLGFSSVFWILLMLVARPPLLAAVLALPVIVAVSTAGFYAWVQFKIAKRLETFGQQLELALRLIAGGVRVGLGLRQSLTLVIEELPNPARHEYMRVVGQTNIGVSILDALDDLASRMPSHEALMMARVIRVQSQTGGDLGKVLDHLADTIKDRRRIHRKIGSLTAEARVSALVLLLIPPVLGTLIGLIQPSMGHAVLFTGPGHLVIIILAVLELVGYLWLKQIMKMDI